MSEDDGLLLNFATEPVIAPFRKKTKESKPKVIIRKDKESKKATHEAKRKEYDNIKIKKRKRIDEPKTEKQKEREERSKEYSLKRAKADALDKNTFVSSLFSSNGENKFESNDDSIKSLNPSNAPLNDKEITFETLGVDSRLCGYLKDKLRFKSPTKIQRLVIPKFSNSTERDLFIQAQTGSGKTLSFALPIFGTLMNLSTPVTRESGVFAIILAPSRELATQIYSVFEKLSQLYVKIVPGIVIGGEKKKSEKARLRKGVNILVSTPGRLLDHLNSTKNLSDNLSVLRWVVLDEGDRLMELGFEDTLKDIFKIIEANNHFSERITNRYPELPKRRINILCSATVKSNVKKLGDVTLNNPELISSGTSDDLPSVNDMATVPDQLTQEVLVVPPKLRLVTLCGLLRDITRSVTVGSRTIVFLSCADSVNFHFDVFSKNGKALLNSKGGARKFVKTRFKTQSDDKLPRQKVEEEIDESSMVKTASTSPDINKNVIVYKLHGMLPQHIRTMTLNHFSKQNEDEEEDESKHLILFCTDVASRGLDLPTISTVIEYDPSFNIDDHLHRVGRTARAGKIGKSILFLIPGDEENYVKKIKTYHHSGLKTLNHEEILKNSFSDKEKNKKWDVEATTWHLNIERWLLEDSGYLLEAEKAFTSHIRAYATHLSSERDCFNIRSLHLGHLAKSFGLRETPKKLGRKFNIGKDDKDDKKSRKPLEDPKKKMLRMASLAVKQTSSEFNFM